jgi:hypothetical protein
MQIEGINRSMHKYSVTRSTINPFTTIKLFDKRAKLIFFRVIIMRSYYLQYQGHYLARVITQFNLSLYYRRYNDKITNKGRKAETVITKVKINQSIADTSKIFFERLLKFTIMHSFFVESISMCFERSFGNLRKVALL